MHILFALLVSLSAHAAPVVNVLDPGVLHDLESHGSSVDEILGGKSSAATTADLYAKNQQWKDVADTIGKPLPHDKNDQLPAQIPEGSGDVPDLVRRLRGFEDLGERADAPKFRITHVSNNSAYPYLVERDGDEPRHFDTRWLQSPFAYLKLIAVVNRIDRRDITRDSCGEVRFIYRLSYRSKTSASSLPFFVNIVEQYPLKSSCAEFAKPWLMTHVDAPSVRKALAGLMFRQFEVNFQSLRFTSGYMHDFGGQAMYIQRIFRRDGGGHLVPIVLENTPDVLAFQKDPSLLKRLVDTLKKPDNLRDLDNGVLNLDPVFLTKMSISWSTLGRARTANRPFREIFRDHRDLLSALDISKLTYIKSTDALIERLDNLSCMGCHQSGGTAGFHTLGEPDPDFSHPFNRQQVALSPHALAEVSRREAYVAAVAAGRTPNAFRPHSTFPTAKWTESGIPDFASLNIGALCFTHAAAFSHAPVCVPRSECRETVVGGSTGTAALGECAATEPTQSAGGVCWMGELRESHDQHADREPPTSNYFAFQDTWKLTGPVMKTFDPYKCVLPQSGAPLGRMSRRCTLTEENFDVDLSHTPRELCANQGGQGFDMCAASGDSGACLESKVARSMLDTCTNERTCREDYICQMFPDYQKISEKDYVRRKNGELINLSIPSKIKGEKIAEARAKGIGFCVPTYFLFNMRLDGHPSPVTGLAPGAPTYNAKLPQRGYKK